MSPITCCCFLLLSSAALSIHFCCLQEYHERFGPVPPVELNDVFFGLHALLLSLLLAGQCLFYKRATTQRLSSPTVLALGLAAAAAGGFAAVLFLQGEGDAPFTWLDLCYMCSFVKMGVTLVKYIPQVCGDGVSTGAAANTSHVVDCCSGLDVEVWFKMVLMMSAFHPRIISRMSA
jgi:hypothetical protein